MRRGATLSSARYRFLAGVVATALIGTGATAAPTSTPGLQQVAGFPHQVTGVSVAPNDRIFVNFPRWTDDAPISVAGVLPGGKLQLYPDARWNERRNAEADELTVGDHFVCVQSIVADAHGALWVLDPGAPGNEKTLPGAPKLVRIDLAANKVTKVIPFAPDVALPRGRALHHLPGENAVRRHHDGKTDIVVTDTRLRWPDTMSEGPDGTLYVTASHIQDTSWFKAGAPASLPTALFSFEPGG